jgi:hypothetical protein
MSLPTSPCSPAVMSQASKDAQFLLDLFRESPTPIHVSSPHNSLSISAHNTTLSLSQSLTTTEPTPDQHWSLRSKDRRQTQHHHQASRRHQEPQPTEHQDHARRLSSVRRDCQSPPSQSSEAQSRAVVTHRCFQHEARPSINLQLACSTRYPGA